MTRFDDLRPHLDRHNHHDQFSDDEFRAIMDRLGALLAIDLVDADAILDLHRRTGGTIFLVRDGEA
ncbi:MAG: hypothetical protein MI723_19920, partial [Caulobacterales bacterium]|nr:hypothetical protein [Caulobacterales bacterium]